MPDNARGAAQRYYAMPAHTPRANCSMRAVAPRCALFAGADRHRRELDLATTRPPRRHDSTAVTPRLTAATARRHQQQTATMQLISTLALATSAAALVAPAAPKASTKLDVATLKNPSSTEFAYGLPGNQIPGVPNSRFDFDPLGFAERASPAEMSSTARRSSSTAASRCSRSRACSSLKCGTRCSTRRRTSRRSSRADPAS